MSKLRLQLQGDFCWLKQKKFDDITNRLLNINQDVLASIADRMSKGDIVKPANQEEIDCFQVIRDLDHIGGKVSGSVTAKKYMRNEIWSLIASKGAPLWYITLSPADVKNSISLYYAGNKVRFDPKIMVPDDRYPLIARNPVACAHFFHFMVQNFIKHVLGVNSNHRGLFGDTSAYYGTVEQQGRLTLHIHLCFGSRVDLLLMT
jgi:Helitron helicase-like domain at N-terminus